jgi:ABC-2 type transport system permease protein
LKTSFTGFWRRNLAFFRLAVLTNLEYRFNFLTDAILQPLVTALIELTLWTAIFASASTSSIAGFTKEYYLAYVLWTAFVTRITTNCIYEHRMIEEIDSGTVNSVLVRPMGFYEYYLSQFIGYKLVTTSISFLIPILAIKWMDFPTDLSRLPMALLLILYYLIFAHTMSFMVATVAFQLNRVHGLTAAKNLALWVFTGEIFPLDILPEPFRTFFINLPFSNAVFVPVGYLTGRVGIETVLHGFLTTSYGMLIVGVAAWFMWKRGIAKYSGQGA